MSSYVPPPPGNYDNYSPGDPRPFSATDAIAYGWRQTIDNIGIWLLVVLLMIVPVAVLGTMFGLIDVVRTDYSDPAPFSVGQIVSDQLSLYSIITNIVLSAVSYAAAAIGYRAALDVAKGLPLAPFESLNQIPWSNVIVTGLLVGLGSAVGTALCFIPGLIFSFFAWFSLIYAIEKPEAGPVAAITSSFKFVAQNLGAIFLLFLLSILVALGGVIACCVGLLVAIPILINSTAYAYRELGGAQVS